MKQTSLQLRCLLSFSLLAFVALMTLNVIFMPQVQAATLTSTVNQNQISLKETLSLTVKYSEQVDGSKLDLSSLKKDFDILASSPQTSNRVSIINGKTTREATTTWNITLTPKRVGRLQIPAFNINGDGSKAITIQASKAKSGSKANQAIAAKVTVNRNNIYVGQQLVIKIELSIDKSVSDIRGDQPNIEGLPIELIDQQNKKHTVNGVVRQLSTWMYIAFPKESGEITIPSLNFTGLSNARRDFFNNILNQGQKVFARSAPVTVTINEPLTSTGNAPWFPSESVDIRAEWSGDKSQLKVGEPITRTITVLAQGQPASAIPPLNLDTNSSDYKSYSDQPKIDDMLATSGLIGRRIEAQAIIPSKAGTTKNPLVERQHKEMARSHPSRRNIKHCASSSQYN